MRTCLFANRAKTAGDGLDLHAACMKSASDICRPYIRRHAGNELYSSTAMFLVYFTNAHGVADDLFVSLAAYELIVARKDGLSMFLKFLARSC